MESNQSLRTGFKTKTKVVFSINRLIVNKKYESRHFNIGSDVWKIKIDINDYEEDDRKHMWYTIGLQLVSSSTAEVSAKFCAFIIDSDNNKYISIEDESTEHKQTKNFKNGETLLLPLAKVEELTANRNLKVGLYIVVNSQNVDINQMGLGYRKYFNNKEFSDFEIRCRIEKFFVSKLILISRSKTFETMFLNDKTKDNEIVVDIDPKVMEQFLRYLYFGDTDQLDFMKEQLLRVAVKYQVFDLKNICENLIYTEIDSKNAYKLWKLFNELNSNKMKDKCIEFIVKNDSEEIRTKLSKNWKHFIKSNGKLFDEILKRYSAQPKNSTDGKDDKPTVHLFSYHYIK